MIERYIAEQQERVRHFLLQYLEEKRERSIAKLVDAIAYALDGGKYLRPVLFLASAEALGAPTEKVLPAAAAIECFHVYSLIHDDLPSMDNADFRRNRPSVHKQFDEATAILAGDTLTALGFELLAQEQAKHTSTENVLALIQAAARVLGTTGLAGGQWLDLDYLQNQDHFPDELVIVYERKTGALIELSVSAPAILLGRTAEIERLRKFGRELGLAYQLIDDILDAAEESSKPTLVRAWGLEKTRRRARELTQSAIGSIRLLQARRLEELACHLLGRKY
jgi:geranylgeranyl pyrophosphate synthase